MKKHVLLTTLISFLLMAVICILFVLHVNGEADVPAEVLQEARRTHVEEMEKTVSQKRFLQQVSVKKEAKRFSVPVWHALSSNLQKVYNAEQERLRLEEEKKAQEEMDRLVAEQEAIQQVVQQQEQWLVEQSYYEEPAESYVSPQEVVSQEPVYAEPNGDYGRLKIPSLGISVALNENGDPQTVVDAWDSAWIYVGATVLIADHCNQAFSGLYGSYIGCAGSILFSEGGSREISCIATTSGTRENGVVYVDGVIWYRSYPGAIIMYTCTYDDAHLFVSVWQ